MAAVEQGRPESDTSPITPEVHPLKQRQEERLAKHSRRILKFVSLGLLLAVLLFVVWRQQPPLEATVDTLSIFFFVIVMYFSAVLVGNLFRVLRISRGH